MYKSEYSQLHRNLSSEKEELTNSLERDKAKLKAQLAQASFERDVLSSDNQAIADLLLQHGLHQFAGCTPKKPVEHLLRESIKLKSDIDRLRVTRDDAIKALEAASKLAESDKVKLEGALERSEEQCREVKETFDVERSRFAREEEHWREEREGGLQKVKLLEGEVSSLKSHSSSQSRSHEIEMKKVKDELQGMRTWKTHAHVQL